jgi:hypothetical protein
LEIRKTELVGIRKAYDKIQDDYENKGYLGTQGRFKPQLTAVVVTKRHHTRFFPLSEEEKVNCPPGTVVDSVVTHPCYFDFFLQSQYAPVGTAKPTYYFVIENDIDFSPRQLQDLTNILCYSYVRATLPVGYVPATYYADRLCDRARCYLKDAYQALKKQLKNDAKDKKKQDKAKKQAAKRAASGVDTSRLAPADDDDTRASRPSVMMRTDCTTTRMTTCRTRASWRRRGSGLGMRGTTPMVGRTRIQLAHGTGT